MIRIEYTLFGKFEYSMYPGELFTVSEAVKELKALLPEAKITRSYYV